MPISRKQFLRNSGLLLGGSMLSANQLFAGFKKSKTVTLTAKHPKQCMWDLKNEYLYFNQIGDSYFDYSKPTPVKNDVEYDAEPPATNAVVDAELPPPDRPVCDPGPDGCDSIDVFDLNTLRYHAYYPLATVHNYTTTPLPVIVLFHAGDYQECTYLDLALMKTFCKEFAQKGFIAITAEYRRGVLLDADPYTSAQQELAIYRGQQDGRGAIRSIVKRNRVNQHNGLFKINEGQFFVGGTSAGSIIAMGCAYYRTQTMLNQNFLSRTGSTYPTIQDALGPVKADYYFAELPEAGTTDKYWPTIAGTLNCWGGISIPKIFDTQEANYFMSTNTSDNPPMIAFQGEMDATVDYLDNTDQDIYYSLNSSVDFVKENRCLLLTSPAYFYVRSTTSAMNVKVKLCSTRNMYCILKSLGKYTELYADSDMGHGLDANSDFGITISSPNDVQLYIVQRAATFFQAIMNGAHAYGDTGRSYFRDCENFRVGCSTADSNDGCTTIVDFCN